MSKTSTADDFRQKAIERSLGVEEDLSLPSGLIIKVRRPSPLWWITHRGILPSRLAAIAAGTAPPSQIGNDELVEYSRFVVKILETVVVEPRIRPNAGPDEVDVNIVQMEDVVAILSYAGGEMTADGQSLSTFRGQPRPTDTGSGRPEVVYPAESDTEPRRSNGLAS